MMFLSNSYSNQLDFEDVNLLKINAFSHMTRHCRKTT